MPGESSYQKACVSIVDYGVGNVGSVRNMLAKIGFRAQLASTAEQVLAADVLILPGVGAFDAGMQKLLDSGLVDPLREKAMTRKDPVLGICLGAQLMTHSSEEGHLLGLGFFDAHTVKMTFEDLDGKWLLPNIGWRSVTAENSCNLLSGVDGEARFYFVHSFKLLPKHPRDVSLTSAYGHPFACGLANDNLTCVQFHPEKSHKFGFAFLRNYMEAVL